MGLGWEGDRGQAHDSLPLLACEVWGGGSKKPWWVSQWFMYRYCFFLRLIMRALNPGSKFRLWNTVGNTWSFTGSDNSAQVIGQWLSTDTHVKLDTTDGTDGETTLKFITSGFLFHRSQVVSFSSFLKLSVPFIVRRGDGVVNHSRREQRLLFSLKFIRVL